MKERLLPKKTLVALGVAAGLALSGIVFDRQSDPGKYRWLSKWEDPNHTIALDEREENFDIVLPGSKVTVEGKYGSYWRQKDFFSVGAVTKDGECMVTIFLPSGEVTELKDVGINAYRVTAVTDNIIDYYRTIGDSLQEMTYDRKNDTKTVRNVYPFQNYYSMYGGGYHPC